MRIHQILIQRLIKLKDTLHVQIKQIYSVRKRVKDACKRQKIEHRKRDYIQQFINVTFMQGIYQPKPRPIRIKCKTIHMLSEEGKQSLPEFLVGASYASNR